MIGGEPYTLGLFDTAGMSTFCPSLHFVIFWVSVFCLWVFLSFSDFPETYLGLFLFFSTRSGRLWPVTSSELSADRCLPGLFFCRLAVLLWKRQRKSASVRNPLSSGSPGVFLNVENLKVMLCLLSVGSRDHPSLSKDALPASRDSDWPAGRPLHHREAGQKQAEAHNPRDGREAGQRPEGCEIRGVLRPHSGTCRVRWLPLLGVAPQ